MPIYTSFIRLFYVKYADTLHKMQTNKRQGLHETKMKKNSPLNKGSYNPKKELQNCLFYNPKRRPRQRTVLGI